MAEYSKKGNLKLSIREMCEFFEYDCKKCMLRCYIHNCESRVTKCDCIGKYRSGKFKIEVDLNTL